MSRRAVQFLQLWLESNDVLNLRNVDEDAAIFNLATLLFFDAAAAGIREHEIMESWDDVRRSVVEKMVRRRLTVPTIH